MLACRSCNRARGHAAPTSWLKDREQRGFEADRAAIERSLADLDEAIASRGGQRRARPYLARELHRIRR